MTTKETVAEYDFAEDAMGFADFLSRQMRAQPDDEIVVYVKDAEGREAVSAKFVRTELSDGSYTTDLIVEFDD